MNLTVDERINAAINLATPYGEAGSVKQALREAGFVIVERPMTDEEVKACRDSFIAAHQHLDLQEDKDAWGRPKFLHSHVDAMWAGWLRHAEQVRSAMTRSHQTDWSQRKLSEDAKARLAEIDRNIHAAAKGI
jgi:hypothetical protein